MRRRPWCSRTSKPRRRPRPSTSSRPWSPTIRTIRRRIARWAEAAAPPEPRPVWRQSGTGPKDAQLKVGDDAAQEGDFVDMSVMILAAAPSARATRLKVADEEASGDEEQDLQEMLTRFKQGID